MKVEIRKFPRQRKPGWPVEYKTFLILIPDEDESKLIDEVFGNEVGDNGIIADVKGVVKLADGYGEHYISLELV